MTPRLSFSLSESLFQEIKQRAEERAMSVSGYIAKQLEQNLSESFQTELCALKERVSALEAEIKKLS